MGLLFYYSYRSDKDMSSTDKVAVEIAMIPKVFSMSWDTSDHSPSVNDCQALLGEVQL